MKLSVKVHHDIFLGNICTNNRPMCKMKEMSGGVTMKNNYFIPGFEPDEIRDMAKSALKQIHERSVKLVKHDHKELNNAVFDLHYRNLNEPYEEFYGLNNTCPNRIRANVFSAAFDPFGQGRIITEGNQMCKVGVTIQNFDRQLDSADHGKNIAVETASGSIKVTQ